MLCIYSLSVISALIITNPPVALACEPAFRLRAMPTDAYT